MLLKSMTHPARSLSGASKPVSAPAPQLSGAQIRHAAIIFALAFWVGIAMFVVKLVHG